MKIKNDKIVIQVICVLVAIGMWMLVMMENNPMQENKYNKIPVKIKNTEALAKGDNAYVLMDDINEFTVNVTVRGLYEDLIKLQSKDIRATAEITDFKEGINSLLVEIVLPEKMEAKVVSPKYITCTIDQIVSVPVDVRVQYQGSQATGYHLSKYGASNPESVIVKGPRSIVNSVSSAIALVNIEGMQETVIQKKPVVLYDNTNKDIDTKYLTITPSSVEASYEIQPVKTVAVKPIVIGVPAEGYKLVDFTSDITTVEIAAPKEILDTIHELETEPLDIAGSNLNMMADKKIIVGKDVSIIGNTNKASVNAIIEKIVEKEIEFSFEEIEFANKGEDFTITPTEEDQTILVTVKAPTSVINELDKEKVKLIVDLIDAVEGVNELVLNVTTLEEVDNITCSVESIKFNLEVTKKEE